MLGRGGSVLYKRPAHKRPWYSIIGPGARRQPLLERITANGSLAIASFKAHGILAKNLTASLVLERGELSAKDLAASAFGGKLSGTLHDNFNAGPPTYEINGKLDGGSVAAISGPMRQDWGSGKLDASFQATAAGTDFASLTKSAVGLLNYAWRDGTVALALDGGAGPLHIQDFRGIATLREGRLSFTASKIATPGGIYMVSGTASLDRQLGLTLAHGKTPAFEITGTLEKPKVTPSSPVAQTQAELHP
jgi:uncharacterized protein involved in outer membrane biogenesis